MAYLRAVFALAPETAGNLLREGLFDAEPRVREFAAAHVPLDDRSRSILAWLQNDRLEPSEVRAAAAARLQDP